MKLIALCALSFVAVLTLRPIEAQARFYSKPTLAQEFQTRAQQAHADAEMRARARLQTDALATAERLAKSRVVDGPEEGPGPSISDRRWYYRFANDRICYLVVDIMDQLVSSNELTCQPE